MHSTLLSLLIIILVIGCKKEEHKVILPPQQPVVVAPAPLASQKRWMPTIEQAHTLALISIWAEKLKSKERAIEILIAAGDIVENRGIDVERVLRRPIFSEGETRFIDLVATLRDLYGLSLRNNGGNRAYARMSMMRMFGGQIGTIISNTSFDKVESLAQILMRQGLLQPN